MSWKTINSLCIIYCLLFQRSKKQFFWFIETSPTLYKLFFSNILPAFKNGLVAHKNTDIVIEGFPRSGNTFAAAYFALMQQKAGLNVKIAHHIHTIGQLKVTRKYNIPNIILLRNPEQSIKSLIIRHPEYNFHDACYIWKSYHKYLINNIRYFNIIEFEEFIKNPHDILSEVIRRESYKFNVCKISYSEIESIIKSY
jgi:hypothetical protein